MSTQHALERIPLGASDLSISPLGIGTWAWGDRFVWGYGRGGYTDVDIQAAFEFSSNAGLNFYDTAEAYGFGRSEHLLGQYTQRAKQSNIIATKFMPFPWRLRQASLLSALRRSLDRLGVEQIGLYQIHWPFFPRPIEVWVSALADAVEAGLTQAVGVSNFNLGQTRRAHEVLATRNVPLASNQVHYSLLHRGPEFNGLLDFCRENSITLIAYSPLAMGVLTGKYTPDNPLRGIRGRRYKRGRLAQIQPLITLMHEIGEAHGGKSAAQVALNWVICKGAVPIPGVKNIRQAQDNAGALGWRLSDEEVVRLDSISKQVHITN